MKTPALAAVLAAVTALAAAVAHADDTVPLTVNAQSRSGTIPAAFFTAQTNTGSGSVIADGLGMNPKRKPVRILRREKLTIRASHQLEAGGVAIDRGGYRQPDPAAPVYAVTAKPGRHTLYIHVETTAGDGSHTRSDWGIPLRVLARPAS